MWLSEASQSFTISRSSRLETLLGFKPALQQCSSLVLVIGCREKFAQCPQTYGLSLHLKDGLLLSYASLYPRKVKEPCSRIQCMAVHQKTFNTCQTYQAAESTMYGRVIYPFADVFCFFSYCFKDVDSIVTRLVEWIRTKTLEPSPVLPHLLIILEFSVDSTSVQSYIDAEINKRASLPLRHFFSAIKIQEALGVRPERKLKIILAKSAQDMQSRRKRLCYAFSVKHFQHLFDVNFSSTQHRRDGFNSVKASRMDFPVSVNLSRYLQDYLSLITDAKDLVSFAGSTIAACLILDHYVPEMHLFSPKEVFNTLYRDACMHAAQAVFQVGRKGGILLPSSFVDKICSSFAELFKELLTGTSAVNVHRQVFDSFTHHWRAIKSSTVCLTCLSRVPEHLLLCGHSICVECLRNLAASAPHDGLLLHYEACLLCHEDVNFRLRLSPDTAGIKLLSIDGGGVRGALSLEILRLLEEKVDLPIPIQEHFDFAYGISAGTCGLSVHYKLILTHFQGVSLLVPFSLMAGQSPNVLRLLKPSPKWPSSHASGL